MAVVIGTNSGFCSAAPTADPAGAVTRLITNTANGYATATKHVAPSGRNYVTEIGWYLETTGISSVNFEVGIYTHNAGSNVPLGLIAGASIVNNSGTAEGWKVVSGLSVAITPGTTYWLAVQCDVNATGDGYIYSEWNGSAYRHNYGLGVTALPASWSGGTNQSSYAAAIYALTSADAPAGGTIIPVIMNQYRQHRR